MQYGPEKFWIQAKTGFAVLALITAGMMNMSAARADEAQAKKVCSRPCLTTWLHRQHYDFNYDSNLEIVTTQNQKLGLASSGTLTLNRPDKVHATRKGGFADIKMVFDGKTLTAIEKDANLYAQVDAPGTIDHLVDELRNKYHRPVPAADLLMSNPYISSCLWSWTRRTLGAE